MDRVERLLQAQGKKIRLLEQQNRKWVTWTGELQEKIERLEALMEVKTDA